jgi:hypothetical protein
MVDNPGLVGDGVEVDGFENDCVEGGDGFENDCVGGGDGFENDCDGFENDCVGGGDGFAGFVALFCRSLYLMACVRPQKS